MNKLIKQISEHSIEYGSIPFWSWNDKLNPEELRRQIRNMKELEMRGFFMHARGGLETEYMSEEWFECINACIDEAKKLGMEAWAYDENGWPSGFAGGKVLENPEYHAVFITAQLSESFPETTDNTLAVYTRDEKGVPSLTDKACEDCKSYLKVCIGTDGSYVDTLRADVTDEFIKHTHEEYKRRLGEDFGGAMPGFFTDEPQYYRAQTPYSKKMPEWFSLEYGYSVLEALPALFINYEGAELHRYNYNRLLYKKFTENFSKRLYDWAEKNGIMITGHFIEEGSLESQLAFCGDIMPQYQYEHIPGIDFLGRTAGRPIMGKQLGSVCAQTGKKKALAEIFACCGWDVSPKELRFIAETQYSGGVNVMCQHLYPYSIRGQRKRDYPAFYSEHNPWQSDMKDFDRYFNNLGYMLGTGEEVAETLVIHPIRSMWLTYMKRPIERIPSSLNNDFYELLSLLGGSCVSFHLGSEAIMENIASISEGKINVGICSYKKIVIPACDTLSENTVRLVKEFMASGGKVYTYKHHLPVRIDGRVADLSFLSGLDDISDSDAFERFRAEHSVRAETAEYGLDSIRTMIRKTDFGRLIYVANLTDKDIPCIKMSIDNCSSLGKINISTLEISPVNGKQNAGSADICFSLEGSESVVLCEYDAPEFLPYGVPAEKQTIKENLAFTIDAISENMLTLDRASISKNGGEFSEIQPLERVRDELLSSRFKGKIVLRFPFEVKDLPKTLKVVTEPFGKDLIKVNGCDVKLGDDYMLDRSFALTDISPYCRVGENFIDMEIDYFQSDYVYSVLYNSISETLRNCLVFDTEIENIYLVGDFALDMKKEDFAEGENNTFIYPSDKPMTLVSPKETLDIRNIVTDGYPFYSGELSASTKYLYRKGDPTVLKLTGRFATAHVKVNGMDAGKLLFSSRLDLANFLKEGENEISITLYRSYRNLLGPHHAIAPEPTYVDPTTFSFEKGWKDGNCAKFRSSYSFVRYGIDM